MVSRSLVSHGLVLDLVEQLGTIARYDTVTLPLEEDERDEQRSVVAAWCTRTGNELVELGHDTVTVRRGRSPDPLAELGAALMPGARLWMYTNFDCNLACDYCCARSSPQAARKALGLDRVRRLASEAVDAGVTELILTGGEPFLLPNLDELVAACTSALPTILLTNGMLFRGNRLAALQGMDRSRLALQISLDSATPGLHDLHRGRGSWERAVAGIRTARDEGFRVRVAATLPHGQSHQQQPFHTFLDSLGVAPEDQVIRVLAHRGVADEGIELTLESLIPEVTVTAEGVYWHPVTAGHEDQFVTADIFPLQEAIAEVRRRFTEMRARATAAGQWFPCA